MLATLEGEAAAAHDPGVAEEDTPTGSWEMRPPFSAYGYLDYTVLSVAEHIIRSNDVVELSLVGQERG